jgi:hypothetical protein
MLLSKDAGCPILACSVRKGGIPQLSNPLDFDRPMPCQTPTAPTSVESHPNVEERDARMGHPAGLKSIYFRSWMVVIKRLGVRFALSENRGMSV